jgi:hypothetical protein
MSNQALITKYLSIDQKHFKNQSKKNPISSKAELFQILKLWRMINKDPTTTIGEVDFKQTPIIWVKVGSKLYYINSDTTRQGVVEFCINQANPWKTILNTLGVANKVTNRIDDSPITGFYMYLS